jgi:peptidoglycan-associated lipoprotein
MNLAYRPLNRTLLLSAATLTMFLAGCGPKKTQTHDTGTYTPAQPTEKPKVTLSADRTTINPGETVRLSWTSTDAVNVSIAPEVGAVTAQGSTSVAPASSTTYTITASGPGGNADASVRITVGSQAAVEETHAPVTAADSTMEQMFLRDVRDVYFETDSAELTPEAREVLRKDADFFKRYPGVRISIEGNCDERGSTEYNLALGDRRANAAKQYLVGLGVPGDRLNTVSYGKEKPVCFENTEACWTKNRHDHFVPVGK